ncbi:MAG: IS481 family transposase [Bacteriovoracaceae bacterium]
MDEKLKFIARLLEGEKMAPLCREFGISRKTGHKLWSRYREMGNEALIVQKRTPYRYANKLPLQIEALILDTKKEFPNWGAPKIREKIKRRFSGVKLPAISTIHAVLDRNGLVESKLRRKNHTSIQPMHLSNPILPNELWCADYKGEFMMGNRQYCYPLTITDHASRYLLACEALTSTSTEFAIESFTKTFKEFGLPKIIKTDNGSPFANGNSLYGLTKLSVWWLRLGIELERTEPGHPQQNGRHERMHLTLKQETTKPAGANLFQQQEKFDSFSEIFNNERPHQAIGMKYPSEIYKPSERIYKGIQPLFYPFHDKTVQVTRCGRICERGLKVSISYAFIGQEVGIKEVEDGIWVVTFLDYDLGYFDENNSRIEPVEDPFNKKVLPMSPE